MSLWEGFGLTPIINAYGTNTRLSGGPLAPEVAAAMVEASRASVDILDLQAAACREIARATGAEAGIATAGASAALLLGTAAILARLDAAAMDRLPRTEAEFLIARSQRNMYDRAVEVAGARLVEVGIPDRVAGAGVRDATAAEFAAAITPATRGILWVAQPHSEPPLPELVEMARAHGLPVLVDAAAQLPPAANLRRFITEGADLVAFSGGKAIGGPQASGILAGRADLVASALMQMLDLDLPAAQFRPPVEFAAARQLSHLPRHGIGRSCKVGREEVAGLLVALRRFTRDTAADRAARWSARLDAVQAGLPAALTTSRILAGEVPMLALHLPDADAARALEARLRQGHPAAHLNPSRIRDGLLLINPIALADADAPRLATLVTEALA
ncbi:MAG: DegT/DnrJ/EryC1/StrS family aminotransferase [Acetobacteraceae bacterium]|nr:DegT/DnrJ/EryC1/StrS family aminotransferase [Acetobacteraceae bacterium]